MKGGEGPVILTGERRKSGEQRGKRRLSPARMDLLADCLSCFVLSTGIGMGILSATVFGGRFLPCAALAVLSLLLLLVLRLRWWLPAGLLAGGGLWLLVTELLGEGGGLGEISSLLLWLTQGAPAHSRYSAGAAGAVLQGLLLFGVTLLVFVYLRRFFWFPAALLTCGGGFALLYRYGHQRPEWGLYLTLAGLVLLAPRHYHRYVLRHSPEETGINRGSMQLLAAPVAAVSLAAALFLATGGGADWRSAPLVNLVEDLSVWIEGPFGKGGRYHTGFSMERAGYMPLGDRLGGPVELDDLPVFSLEMEGEPFLLRGAVEDVYTGYSWEDSRFDGDFRLASLLWRGYRTQAFDLDKPLGDADARQLFERITRPVQYQMTYSSDRYSVLFSSGQVEWVGFDPQRVDLQAHFDLQSELFAQYRLPRQQRVQVRTQVFSRSLPAFDGWMLELEAALEAVRDPMYEELVERYTQLPEDYSPRVRETAASIVEDAGSPYARAQAIQEWLARECVYTLNPAAPPEGTDFVEHFLQTREGYCTYFASAMVVLARCEEIPARYVTGYGLEASSPPSTRYRATNRTAHAWAELYFSGVGWVEFDPLSWNPHQLLTEEDEGEAAAEEAGAEELSAGQEREEAGEPLEPDAGFVFALSPRMLAAGALALVAVSLGLRKFGRWLWGLPLRRGGVERMLRRTGGPAAAMDGYYRDILAQLQLLGIEPQPGDTLIRFGQTVDRQIRLDCPQTMERVCELRMRQHYREEAPGQEELEIAHGYRQALERRLEKRLSRPGYLWRRVLHL